MYQQSGLFFYFYRFRYVFASLLTVAFLMLVSALVTALGSNTVLNTKAHPSTNSILDSSMADSQDAVTNVAVALGADIQRATISTGRTIYGVCRSVTTVTDGAGKSIAQGGADVVSGVGEGIAFAGHGVASGVLFTLHTVGTSVMFAFHLPSRTVGSITRGHTVSDIIRPADDTSVPVISSQTSTAALARLSAAQQQEISQLQAAQLTANQSLDGAIVAGDPTHGGYPAAWDNARQDSRLDHWGMYNRECVSYTAWKVYQTYGTMPYWGGEGNANEWPGDARRAGIPTGSVPKVGSVAIWNVGYYGHAMWVQKVQGDMVYVSQYNYDLNGKYSEMWVNGSHFTYIYFK